MKKINKTAFEFAWFMNVWLSRFYLGITFRKHAGGVLNVPADQTFIYGSAFPYRLSSNTANIYKYCNKNVTTFSISTSLGPTAT